MSAEAVSAGADPLAADELARIDAYWRAANYLSVGQIYLLDNPLLREPLRLEHVKPRLLGHWACRGSRSTPPRCAQHVSDERLRHRDYTREVGDDPPDVRDWVWPGDPPPREAATDAHRGERA